MKTLIERKKEVLNKIYGGVRKPYMHKFRLSDGVCEYCNSFLGEKGLGMMCKILTPDEVKLFKYET